jgi:ubiquinone/menaquinone biosynthesis C-methylase UbiE
MNKYETTITTWNRIAKLYQDTFMDLELYNDTYNAFCDGISKQDPNILEVGCGPGNITKYLLQQRPDFKILVTDVAPNMLALAKKNIPQATFKALDARNISQITETFEGIMCGFCLPYLNKEDCLKFLQDSYNLLNKDGLLYLSVLEGDYNDSSYQKGSSGDTMFVHYYNEAFFKEQLIALGFKDLQIFKKAYTASQGDAQVHLIIVGRK